ncbi:hypothetical protein AALH30_05510 [Blautia pseudococcoides]|uniref:hypothetical protein n=1 Tax=Blautia pseudococcoides TaxID=1796616 RepID=UPI00148AF97E|nr:hypothetical protein [Blautia pseudococcoides]QJU15205.1 hypothetical protein HL650_12525 [Blautia pseudococcoides]
MKTGKITAKLRDAVPVCLMVEGKEVKRYKNIDLPDMLKEVEMLDFHFNVPADGKITFEINYAPGVLPEVFPEPRAKMTRAEKAAVKAVAKAVAEQESTPEENAPVSAPESPQEVTALAEVKPFDIKALIAPPTTGKAAPETESVTEEAAEQATEESEAKESDSMKIHYNVTGPRRKELAAAVGNFIGTAPVYMKAPTYGFAVGNYIIDKNGTLIGKENKELIDALTAQNFTAA